MLYRQVVVILFLIFSTVFGVVTFQKESSSNKALNSFPFQNSSLSFKERVDDLVSRLSIDELLEQITRGGAGENGPAPSIPRLGIQPYQWTTECLHGYMNQATIFPQALGLAATFDKSLIYEMAKVISIEARAKHADFMKNKNYGDQTGLSCYAPVINIMRHPLWGRNQETYGEDPVLTGEMAQSYVTGLQGHYQYKPATATCKHFGVHGGPEDKPVSRFSFDSIVSNNDLGNTFLPAFRKCVKSGAHAVMCSYNAINGVPACANHMMMNETLRGKFGFEGYVVSDENAIENVDVEFKYTWSPNATAIACKKAGCDLELTAYGRNNRYSLLGPLVKDGFVSEESIIESARRLFYTRMSLGEFNQHQSFPWSNVSLDVVQSDKHIRLAEDIAAKSFVLLKNQDVLPITYHYDNVSMVGPFSDNGPALVGDYAYIYNGLNFSYPSQAAYHFSRNGSAKVINGCLGKVDSSLAQCTSYNSSAIKEAVKDSELVLLTLGTGPGIEAEFTDRNDMYLPGKQDDIIKEVVEFAPRNATIILLLFNAGPLVIQRAFEHSRIHAIVECFFPGQAAGGALIKVLSGEVNPAARLPNTWYADMGQVPPMIDYSMEGRTYKYLLAQPLFPFGYGLSYTRFEYKRARPTVSVFYGCESVKIEVEVENVGERDGEEVIQVYMKPLSSTVDRKLLHKLVAFERIYIKAKESVVRYISIPHSSLAVWKLNVNIYDYYLEAGKFLLFIGGQQPAQSTYVPSNVIETEFSYIGPEIRLSECEK